MVRKTRWYKSWSNNWLADKRIRHLSPQARGYYADMLAILRTRTDEVGKFVIRGTVLDVQQIARYLGLYDVGRRQLIRSSTRPELDPLGPHAAPPTRSDGRRHVSSTMMRHHAVREIIASGLLAQDASGVYLSPRIVAEELETTQRSARAITARAQRGRQGGLE